MLLFAFSGDDIGSTANLLQYFAENSGSSVVTFNATGGLGGGGCLHITDDDFYARAPLPARAAGNRTFIRLAAWTKCDASASDFALAFTNQAGTEQGQVILVAGNTINYRPWSPSPAGTLTSIAHPFADTSYHCWEMAITYQDSGNLKVWIDGAVEFNSTLDLFGSGTVDIRNVRIYGQIGEQFWDDILIWDDEDNGDGFVGEIGASKYRLTTVLPDADGDDSQFTALGGGAKYLEVDDTGGHDSDTSYVESATIGHRQLYGFGALPTSPTSIKGVVSNMWVRNPDIGVMNFKHKAKSGATLAESASLLAPESYGLTQRAFSVDPNTAAAWSKAGVDAAQFGIEVV